MRSYIRNRILIEGCTNPGSLLSEKTPWSKGCKIIPVDKNDDWCSTYTLNKCRGTLSGRKSALWFSSPCTGGTSWTHVNMHRGSATLNKIKGYWAEFRKLRKRLEEIACVAIPHGVAIFIEWPRGCRYWTNSNVARFLDKYGFKFVDFDGCMYGLVASHGKGAGLTIKKPWRVAYLNSSLGEFLHLKCDGSHEHSPCSGRNTSDTERYTPMIARAVHQCLCRDAKRYCMSRSDNADTVMPAAISVLKLAASDEHDRGVDLLTAGNPSQQGAPGEDWPDLQEGVAAKSTPKSRKWGIGRGSGAAGSGSHGQQPDAVEEKVPDDDVVMKSAGSDQKVDEGQDGRWRALENVRCIPTQGDRRQLMNDIFKITECDPGALYEWLKNSIISCRYTVPVSDTQREIKLKTIVMLRKMLDPDGVCGHNVTETTHCRRLAQHCTYLFANTAGEMICQWTDADKGSEPYFPACDDNTTATLGQQVGEGMKTVEDCSLNPTGDESPGPKTFECPAPVTKEEIRNLDKDDENVVICPSHGPENNLFDCVFCHVRQQQLVAKAEIACKKADKGTKVHGVEKVFHPLPSAKEFPTTT